MLVLSVKTGRKIYIGDDIIVTLCEIDKNKVRIGVAAPRTVIVDRGEVHERKQRQAEGQS